MGILHHVGAVTEYGDPDGAFGYLFGSPGRGVRPAIDAALAIDIPARWDDPDYEFLAFIGRDRPFPAIEVRP